jgi:hypothetical protein
MGARIVNMVFVADVAQRKSAASQAGGVGSSLSIRSSGLMRRWRNRERGSW